MKIFLHKKKRITVYYTVSTGTFQTYTCIAIATGVCVCPILGTATGPGLLEYNRMGTRRGGREAGGGGGEGEKEESRVGD